MKINLNPNSKAIGVLALIILYSTHLHGQYMRFDHGPSAAKLDTTSVFSERYRSNLARIVDLSSWIDNNRSGCPDAKYYQQLDSIYNVLKSYTTNHVNYAQLSQQINDLADKTNSAYKDFYERVSPYGMMLHELTLKKRDSVDSLLLEGIRLHENEQFESALQLFNRVIDMDSTRLNNYYFAIDNELFVRNDTAKAFHYLDKVVRMNKENKKLNFSPSDSYMYLYAMKQQYEKSLEYADKAIETDSSNYKAIFMKATIYKELKNYPLSNKSFKELLKSIQHQPFASYSDSAFIYNSIAWNYYLMKEYRLCVEFADISLQLIPNNSSAFDTRASGYYGLGEYQKCINEMTKALRLNPELENSWYLRGLSYKQLNMTDKACNDLSMAVSLGNKAALEEMTDYCRKETIESTLNQYKIQDSTQKRTNKGIYMNRFGYFYFFLN